MLRHWANDNKKNAINMHLILLNKTVSPASLKEQAFEYNYYGENQEFEKDLSRMESNFSVVTNEIINSDLVPQPNTPEKYVLLMFALTLYGRTPNMADAMDSIADGIAKVAFKHDPVMSAYLEQCHIGCNTPALLALGVNVSLFPFVMDLGLIILENNTVEEFILSDNPASAYNQFFEQMKRPESGKSFGTKGYQLFVPISPRYALFLYDDDVYSMKCTNHKVILTNSNDVISLNCLQAINSSTCFFFRKMLPPKGITKYMRMIKKHEGGHKWRSMEYENVTDRTSSLVIMDRPGTRINLQLSFVKLRNKARQYDFSKNMVHERNPLTMTIYRQYQEEEKKGNIGRFSFYDYFFQEIEKMGH
jgi:hypothetical protein